MMRGDARARGADAAFLAGWGVDEGAREERGGGEGIGRTEEDLECPPDPRALLLLGLLLGVCALDAAVGLLLGVCASAGADHLDLPVV